VSAVSWKTRVALVLVGRAARRALARARADLAALPLADAVARRTSSPPAGRRRPRALRAWNAAVAGVLTAERESHPCLLRSLALLEPARACGYAASLAVGVRRGDAGIESHAWLLLDGSPFLEPHERAAAFETVTVLPAAGGDGTPARPPGQPPA
jgi:hypothetical protein